MVTSLGIGSPGQHEQEHRVGEREADPGERVPGQRGHRQVTTVTAAAMYMLLRVLLGERLQGERLAGRRRS